MRLLVSGYSKYTMHSSKKICIPVSYGLVVGFRAHFANQTLTLENGEERGKGREKGKRGKGEREERERETHPATIDC